MRGAELVLILRHEPQEYDAQARVRRQDLHRAFADGRQGAKMRVQHGARAVLLVNDTANHSGSDTLDKFSALTAPGDPGIPFLEIKAEIVEGWFRAAGKDFRGIQQAIDGDLRPRSFAFPDSVTVDLEAHVEHSDAWFTMWRACCRARHRNT